MKHAISWFEIPVTDYNRAKKFYSEILDIEINEMPGMGNYGLIMMDSDKNAIGGALVAMPEYVPSDKGVLIYFNGGDDLSGILNRVEAAGGKIIVPKTLITPEIGHFAKFMDTEGNQLALHSMN